MMLFSQRAIRRKAVWAPKRTFAIALLVSIGFAPNAIASGRHSRPAPTNRDVLRHAANVDKLDGPLRSRIARNPSATTRVIVTLQPGAELPPEFKRLSRRNAKLRIIGADVIEVPNSVLKLLAAHPSVFSVRYDRPVGSFNYLTSLTVGSRAVQQMLGLTGAGVGVAVIDSGIATWHDDLTNWSNVLYPYGNQRVAGFVDFVNGQIAPYDDNGHGSHVAGIIAGNGYDSNSLKAGAAPDASLISLKVLDANGAGTISSVISALDWVLANHAAYNIRVVNLSVGAAIHESYWTDPLTLAAKLLVDAGVVVVAAAGNFGKNSAGLPQYGGISAPGNAPWVLTVGASSTNGSPTRADDTVATFSSRGPTYLDWEAKPDLVAPGVGTVSMTAPGSTYDVTKAPLLVPGSVVTAAPPYLTLSGTSMAAPVVSGVVALMLQANPTLTPNAVKAILQYTAEIYPDYDALTEGGGFLNAVGAVRLARFFATAQPGDQYPTQSIWSKQIIWGNHRLTGGAPTAAANAWNLGTTWGIATTAAGDNIVWGTQCGAADCDNIVWGTDDGDNIVWGTSANGDNIVWGTSANGDNIVWGTDCGGADCDNIVWGTVDGDNIVWGTAREGDNIVWGTVQGDNMGWGTNAVDDVVWPASDGDNIVWGTAIDVNSLPGTGGGATLVESFDSLSDAQILEYAASPASPPVAGPPMPPVDGTPIVLDPTILPTGDVVIGLDVPVTIVPITIVPPVAIILPGGGF